MCGIDESREMSLKRYNFCLQKLPLIYILSGAEFCAEVIQNIKFSYYIGHKNLTGFCFLSMIVCRTNA